MVLVTARGSRAADTVAQMLTAPAVRWLAANYDAWSFGDTAAAVLTIALHGTPLCPVQDTKGHVRQPADARAQCAEHLRVPLG